MSNRELGLEGGALTFPISISNYMVAQKTGWLTSEQQQCESKKVPLNVCPWQCQMSNNFQNSFTVTLSSMFAMNSSLQILSHLQCVTTLPCETSNSTFLSTCGQWLSYMGHSVVVTRRHHECRKLWFASFQTTSLWNYFTEILEYYALCQQYSRFIMKYQTALAEVSQLRRTRWAPNERKVLRSTQLPCCRTICLEQSTTTSPKRWH